VHAAVESYDLYVQALKDAGMQTTPSKCLSSNVVYGIDTGKDDTLGSTARAIYAGGKMLTTNYLLQGKMKVTAVATNADGTPNNPHVEIGFTSTSNRFLLWNNDKDNAFGLGWCANGTHTSETAQGGVEKWVFDGVNPLELTFKLLVTENDAFLYVDGVLELIGFNIPNLAHGLTLGSARMATRIYDLTCDRKGDASGAYESALLASEVQKYLVNPGGNNLAMSVSAIATIRNGSPLPFVAYDDDFILEGNGPNNAAFTGLSRDWLYFKDGVSAFAGDLAFTYDVTILDADCTTISSVTKYANNSFYTFSATETNVTLDRGVWDKGHHLIYWKTKNASAVAVTYRLNPTLKSGLTATSFRATTVRHGNTLYLGLTVGSEHIVRTVALTDGSSLALWLGGSDWNFRIQNLSFSQTATDVTAALAAIGVTA